MNIFLLNITDKTRFEKSLKEIRMRKKTIMNGLIAVVLNKDCQKCNQDFTQGQDVLKIVDKVQNTEIDKRMQQVEVDYTHFTMKESHVGSNNLMDELLSVLIFFNQPQLWNPHQQCQIQNRTIMMYGPNGTGKLKV